MSYPEKVYLGDTGEVSAVFRPASQPAELKVGSVVDASYLATGCDADRDGNLVVLVKNNTPVPVTDVGIALQFRDGAGVLRRADRRIGGVIGPGEVVNLRTGLGPYTPGSGCPVQVTSAREAR